MPNDASPLEPRTDASWISVTINGEKQQYMVEHRVSLADFIRNQVGLKGTHLGCEHGSCGACTIILDGKAVRSCLLLAIQADQCSLETIEGLADDGVLNALQESFRENHALQCGYCTSGFLMSLTARLREGPIETESDAREALSGNICRCTGYTGMVAAVLGLEQSDSKVKGNK